MRWYLALLATKEMGIKTTLRCHFTPIRIDLVWKNKNNKCWQGCGETGTLEHC